MTGEFSAMPTGSPAPAPPESPLDRLGPRALHRAAPRLGPVLGGVGALLGFVGLLILSFDTSDITTGEGDTNKMIGVLLCLAGTVAGYALLGAFKDGGLATFGSAVAATLVPFVFFFLTWDESDSPPFSIDVILLLSVACWLAAYLLGPSRGRPVFLGAAALGLWLFALEQVESTFTAPFQFLPFSPVETIVPGSESGPPDGGTIGMVSLVFGIGYLVAAFVLDRQRYRGMATPLFLVGAFALYTGYFSVVDDLEPAGTGVLMIAGGAVITFLATRAGRRGTAWVGGAGVGIGIVYILVDVFQDTDDVVGPAITLMVVGTILAFAADRWAAAINEPPEVEAEPGPEPEPVAPPPEE